MNHSNALQQSLSSDPLAWLAVAGLVAITALTRGFFAIPKNPWPLPAWLTRGLRYAPLAALSAVIAPEIVLRDGTLITTWADARVPAALAAAACFAWRRSVLGTIGVGMLVYLPLKIGLGW